MVRHAAKKWLMACWTSSVSYYVGFTTTETHLHWMSRGVDETSWWTSEDVLSCSLGGMPNVTSA